MKKAVATTLSVIHLIITIIFLFQLFNFNILPTKYFLVITGILLLFNALTLGLAKAKKGKIAGIFFSIIFIAVLTIGNYYIYVTTHTLDNVTNHPTENITSEDEYVSIIVLADNQIENISDLKEKNVGLDASFQKDKMIYASEWIFDNYHAEYYETQYNRIDLLIDDLYNGTISAIILDSTRYSICDDVKTDFFEETKEVAKLKIDYTELYKLTPTPTPTTVPAKDPDSSYTPLEGAITERPFIVYISGIDTYGTIASKSRSDTNILMAVDPIKKKILLVSTPRDTYTPLYGVSGEIKDKLTHAGIYGPECSMGTLATLYNTQIEYYVRVNFSSVINIVDALGGIDVYSAYSFHSRHLGGFDFTEGMNHMAGEKALSFCRERYAFPDGDYQRGRNHIEVIKGVINKVASPSILTNYSSLMSALSDSFQTNMTTDEITSLVKMQLSDGGSWSFESMTLANTGSKSTTCYSLSGPSLYVGIVNETSRQAIEDALADFMGY